MAQPATSLGLTTTRSSGRFSFWRKEEKEEGGELVRMSAGNKPYCELGKLLDVLARSRNVRGSYNIAEYLNDRTNYEVSGQSVSKYLFGINQPKRAFIVAFADAFELTEQERAELAWTYAYGSQPYSLGGFNSAPAYLGRQKPPRRRKEDFEDAYGGRNAGSLRATH